MNRFPRWLCVHLVFLIFLSGCSTLTEHKAHKLLQNGHESEGLSLLAQLAQQNPKKYRMYYIQERDLITQRLLKEAHQLEAKNKNDEALNHYREILAYDPENSLAIRALELQIRSQRQESILKQAQNFYESGDTDQALTLLGRILAENPTHSEAKQRQQTWEIERNRHILWNQPLKAALRKPVSIAFRNTSIQSIFDILAQTSGLNFIFDRDAKIDQKTTVYARDTSIEDVLAFVLKTNQLNKKVLSDSTLLIYPDTTEKQKQYEDLIVRNFYLNAADPRKIQEMLRVLVNPKFMYIDDKMKLLVVRDSLDVIEAIEKIVHSYDIPEPEVSLDVEILEISSDKLLNLGIQYPDQLSASVKGVSSKAGELTINEIRHLNREDFTLHVPDPLATLNFKQTSGDANLLANPQIRVRNKEKAKVLIGDKVPVVTTTTNQTSSSVSESVSYLDVGLKLEVEPEVYVNNDVGINIGLEVSNIVKEVKTSTGLLTYQIGTRNANTVLRLHDGETQMLAGLLKDEERNSASHFPGLGKLPFIGTFFSNKSGTKTKSEIVLLITPHIVRGLNTPAANNIEFLSGTNDNVTTHPFRLSNYGQVSLTNSDILMDHNNEAIPIAIKKEDINDSPVSINKDSTILTMDGSAPTVFLDVVSPAQIPVNKEFTIALMLSSDALAHLDFDLIFDKLGLELVRAMPVGNLAGFTTHTDVQSLHIHTDALTSHSGPFVMLTMKATQVQAEPINLTIRQVKAYKTDDAMTTVNVAPARTLLVTP